MPVIRSMEPTDLLLAAVDIAIVAYVFYRIFLLIRGTRAIQLVRGLIVIVLAYVASGWLHLETTRWLLEKVWVGLAVAVPIVFQPELRRALEHLGRGRLFQALSHSDPEVIADVLEELSKAIRVLARNKVGALIVLERETGLNDFIETGIRIDAVVTAELLVNIFIPNTPLHDGAVIMRGGRVLAAATFLPLAEPQSVGPELGSRHRAALGITEHSDALAVVVSEESGTVSLAQGGKLIRNLDEKTLREMLENLLPQRDAPQFGLRPRRPGHGE